MIATFFRKASLTKNHPLISRLSTFVKEEFKNVGEFIDKVVKENEVVLFIKGTPSAPQCGFSRNVVKILQLQGKHP
jgi:hypothetical protein